MVTERNGPGDAGPAEDEVWRLGVYVLDDSPRARLALENLKRLCEEHLPGRFEIEVIDLEKDPGAALRDDILAVPSVVRKQPQPARTLVGTLADQARSRSHLGLGDRRAGDEATGRDEKGEGVSGGV